MGKKIDQLDPYGAYDLDKMRKDIYEVSKNSGTSGAPVYADDGSRQIALENIAELVALILPYFILTSPDGHRWKVTIDNNGDLQREDLGI